MRRRGTGLLLDLVEDIACNEADGHFAILKFTTGYRAGLGTPDLDSHRGRRAVRRVPVCATLEESLARLILDRCRFDGAAIPAAIHRCGPRRKGSGGAE